MLLGHDMPKRLVGRGGQELPGTAIDFLPAVQARKLLLPLREALCGHRLLELLRSERGGLVL